MTRFAVFLSLSLLLVGGAAAQEFSSLEERMSAADFRAAGLDKLSAEELRRLNDWLRANGLSGAAFAPAPGFDRRGLTETRDDAPIVAQVAGEFRGWSGSGDRIELQNGQVWETTDPAAQLAVRLQSPTVRIEPGMLGAWFLTVEGYNSNVRVRRVR